MLADRSELAGRAGPPPWPGYPCPRASRSRSGSRWSAQATAWPPSWRSLRLGALDAVPLAPVEAVQALPALVGTQGGSPDLAGVSLLLYALQRLTFGGRSERWLGPLLAALLGGLSPLLFYWLRDRMSRGGALVAALLWSVSPLAVWSSRLAVGDALVPTAALAWLSALASSRDRRGWGLGVGLTFGLLLLSGPNACTVLLAALAAGAVLRQEMPVLMAGVLQDRRGVLAGPGDHRPDRYLLRCGAGRAGGRGRSARPLALGPATGRGRVRRARDGLAAAAERAAPPRPRHRGRGLGAAPATASLRRSQLAPRPRSRSRCWAGAAIPWISR